MATKPTQRRSLDPRLERANTLREFLRLATKALTKHARLRSVVLECSQSVMSEMGDAITGPGRNPVLLSTRSTPSGSDEGSLRLEEQNGAAFAAMLDPDDYYNDWGWANGPLAIVERVGGAIRAAWIGAPIRPALDLPAATKLVKQPPLSGHERALVQRVLADPADLDARGVLRDAWLERGDVRGELLALTMAHDQTDAMRARAAAIVLEHGRSWLGKLQSVIPFSGALFGPGPFVRKAIVHANERAWHAVARAPEWATVEEIVFTNTSHRAISPAMKNLRAVGPIYADQLEAFTEGTWLVNKLDLVVTYDPRGTLARLAKVALPLTRLRLHAEAIDLAPLAKAAWWSSLERIELWLPEDTTEPVDAMIAAFTKLAKRAPCPVAVGALASNGQRTGWMIAGTAKSRTLELQQPDLRAQLGADLAKRLRMKLPTAWQPADDDWLPLGLGVPVVRGKPAKPAKPAKRAARRR